jgi:hypothetical protein
MDSREALVALNLSERVSPVRFRGSGGVPEYSGGSNHDLGSGFAVDIAGLRISVKTRQSMARFFKKLKSKKRTNLIELFSFPDLVL